MNFIVLVKQVPDITHIPEEAWDRDNGTLRRGILEAVLNPLDLQALTFACRLKEKFPGSRVVCLTMGPRMAREVLVDCLSRGADEAVLLTDMKFSGADTAATAYALAFAIRKIATDILPPKDYVIVSGMQSVDGDTAQVPPQVAEELGIEHIAYAQSFRVEQGKLAVQRSGPKGMETIVPQRFPFLITVTPCMAPLYRSFWRTREAGGSNIHEWNAEAIGVADDRIGVKGSRTWVAGISSAYSPRLKPCIYPFNIDELLDRIEIDFVRAVDNESMVSEPYVLGNKTPSYKGEVWVYAEEVNGSLSSVSRELLGKARELASFLHEKVAAVLVGNNVMALAQELGAWGADKVYVAEHALLKDFLPQPYKRVVAALVHQYRPQIMLFGATPLGRELAPRIAYAVGAGLTADCTGLTIADHEKGHDTYWAVLKQTRPALGGNIMATIITKDASCQMATVRPGVFKSLPPDHARSFETVKFEASLDETDFATKMFDSRPLPVSIRPKEVDIIVSGGRGMGSKIDFEKYLMPLADALSCWLKASVELAGSRSAVEDGFISRDRQVGQTGQTLRPKLYVAVAISGAIQHIAGMQNSRIILSVNQDQEARIFSYSDYGIAADFKAAVPELIEAIQKRIDSRSLADRRAS